MFDMMRDRRGTDGLFALLTLACVTACGTFDAMSVDAAPTRPDASAIEASSPTDDRDAAAPAPAAPVDAALEASVENGPLAFVFAGESNAGGLAQNNQATAAEVAPRASVQIMNLYSGTLAFEPLDIGFNNNCDHAGISDNVTLVPHPPNDILVHGMELGLANAVEAGTFGAASVYLIKTGQGGSQVAQWAVGGVYWAKFLERTNAAKAKLPASTRWVVWYSQGLNDANASVPIAKWKTDTTAHLQKIKAQLPGCQIILTEFESIPGTGGGYPAYDAAIRELVAADPTLVSVATDGAANDGAFHWTYAGFKDTVVPALVAKTKR